MHPRLTSRRFSATPLLFLLSTTFVYTAPSRAAEPAVKLDALVTEVTSRHPELAFYEAEIAAAKAGARSAASWADPELSLSAGHKRVRDFSGALAGEGTAWSVSLTQTFEWSGRLAIRKALANGQISLAELGLARFRNALESRARTLAYSLHAAHTRAATVREVADRFTALKETFLAREPAGLTPLLETRVIEAAELSLQRRAAEAELTLHAARYEEIRTSFGTFNTLVLEPRMEKTPPKGMFKKGSSVRVWISQDERRLPVRFEVEFKIGTGVATLTRYEAPPSAAVSDAKNSRP